MAKDSLSTFFLSLNPPVNPKSPFCKPVKVGDGATWILMFIQSPNMQQEPFLSGQTYFIKHYWWKSNIKTTQWKCCCSHIELNFPFMAQKVHSPRNTLFTVLNYGTLPFVMQGFVKSGLLHAVDANEHTEQLLHTEPCKSRRSSSPRLKVKFTRSCGLASGLIQDQSCSGSAQ